MVDRPASGAKSPVTLSTGLGEFVLEEEPAATSSCAEVEHSPEAQRRDAAAAVVRRFPTSPGAWAILGDAGRDDVEAYAAYRVGYHRGLDALRHQGWTGSGLVQWTFRSNRGFLRCLEGLRVKAEAIGEREESERCAVFLGQLDPTWAPGRFVTDDR